MWISQCTLFLLCFFHLKVNPIVLSLHANSLSLGQNLLLVPAGWESSKMSSANLKNVNIQLSTNLCNYHSQLCYPQVKLARLWGWLHWWMQEGLTGWLCCWPQRGGHHWFKGEWKHYQLKLENRSSYRYTHPPVSPTLQVCGLTRLCIYMKEVLLYLRDVI